MIFSAARIIARSEVAADLVERWNSEHRQARIARDLDELVAELIDTLTLLEQGWPRIVDEYFTGNYPLDAGRKLVAAMERSLSTASVAISSAATANVDRLPELKRLVEVVEKIHTDASRYWRSVERRRAESAASVAAAHEDYVRGDYQTIDEILAELIGDGQNRDAEIN